MSTPTLTYGAAPLPGENANENKSASTVSTGAVSPSSTNEKKGGKGFFSKLVESVEDALKPEDTKGTPYEGMSVAEISMLSQSQAYNQYGSQGVKDKPPQSFMPDKKAAQEKPGEDWSYWKDHDR